MSAFESGYLPHENPCAQCGKPIASPEWFESGTHRVCYLWRCDACGYQFETMAFFPDPNPQPLAA